MFDDATALYFELTADEYNGRGPLVNRERGSLAEDLGQELYDRVRRDIRYAAHQETVKLPFALAGFAVHPYLELNLSPNRGVDLALYERAANNDVAVQGLETAAEQLAGLSTIPRERIVTAFATLLTDPSPNRTLCRSIVRAYLEGDSATMSAARTQMENNAPELAAAVLGPREAQWLPKVRSIINGGETTVVAVGALHLTDSGEYWRASANQESSSIGAHFLAQSLLKELLS